MHSLHSARARARQCDSQFSIAYTATTNYIRTFLCTMNSKATSIVDLSTDLKKNRDEMKPLKEQLIEDMKTNGQTSIAVGSSCIKLVEKKTRKAVGTKAMYNIIKQKLGDKAETDVRAACEKARGEPVIKHTLKICEAETAASASPASSETEGLAAEGQ